MTTIEEAFEKYWSSLADAPNDSPQVVASCKWAAYHAWHAAIEQYAAERVTEARKPLNFDQIQGVMSVHFGSHELTDDEKDSAEAFARAIERAHGIGEKQNG